MNQQLRNHVVKLLSGKTRLDGRGPLDYREPINIEYDISKSAEGSAQVTIGDTVVIAGVKMEVMEPYGDAPDQGSLMVGVELLPLSNPDFETGPPSIQAIELARVVDRGIRESKAVDVKKLCIREGELAWMVIVDICVINDAGNLYDASALATLAALSKAKLPALDEHDKVDYKNMTEDSVPLVKMPIAVTVFKIGEHYVVDPNYEEGQVYDARLTVTTIADGQLCALQKGGDSSLTIKDVDEMVKIATDKAQVLRKLFE
jgi:exosome complex component RRP42